VDDAENEQKRVEKKKFYNVGIHKFLLGYGGARGGEGEGWGGGGGDFPTRDKINPFEFLLRGASNNDSKKQLALTRNMVEKPLEHSRYLLCLWTLIIRHPMLRRR
jgi:hypothetical protein